MPIPGPNPSGEDARYTDIFDRIKDARREDLDLPVGAWQRERKSADWSAVANLCASALTHKTKDLQIASWLTEALVHRDGFPGLREGLNLLAGLIDQFWTTVYPRAEEDELEFRAGPIEWVGSRLDITVKKVPLTPTGLDWFGWTACRQAVPVECGGDVDAFTREHFRARLDEVDSCLSALRELEASCEIRFGAISPCFDGLRSALELVRLTLQPSIGKTANAGECEGSQDGAGSAAVDLVRPSPESNGRNLESFDSLHFTVTAPAAVVAASSVVVSVWAHLESQRAAVMDRARQQHGSRDPLGMMSISKGPVRIAHDTMLTVRLEVPGARVEDPEDFVLWAGEIGSANFVVTVRPEPAEQVLPGKAVIYLNGVRVARVEFVLQVGKALAEDTVPVADTRVRKAFASYDSADRDEVLGRLQGIRKVAPNLEIVFDVLTLRSGQRWKSEIRRLIEASDVFYLFWSLNASRSAWVQHEWRTALRTRRSDFIDPVPLQSPEEAPPPPELSRLHFNDWMLAFQRRRLCRSVT